MGRQLATTPFLLHNNEMSSSPSTGCQSSMRPSKQNQKETKCESITSSSVARTPAGASTGIFFMMLTEEQIKIRRAEKESERGKAHAFFFSDFFVRRRRRKERRRTKRAKKEKEKFVTFFFHKLLWSKNFHKLLWSKNFLFLLIVDFPACGDTAEATRSCPSTPPLFVLRGNKKREFFLLPLPPSVFSPPYFFLLCPGGGGGRAREKRDS